MTSEPLPRSAEPFHDGPSRGRFQSWFVHLLVAAFFALLVGFVFRPWLRPYEQPQRGGPEPQFRDIRAGDLTPLFSVWTQVTARSLFRDGEFPLWSDHIYSGEPFFAKPQIGVISLTTLLCAVLPAQVAATWTFLLHLWIAGMSAYTWGLSVLRRPVDFAAFLAAACGGVTFMLSGLMIEHTMIGHGPIVLVACWTPLVLRSLMLALSSDRPVRHATLAGVLVAVQLLAGGETMFLYNVIAGGLVGLAWVACWRSGGSQSSLRDASMIEQNCGFEDSTPGTRVRRVIFVAVIIGVVGFALSAFKILPGLTLMPLSNRAGGLTLDDAAGVVYEFHEPALVRTMTDGAAALKDFRSLFLGTMVAVVAGVFAAWRDRRRRWLAAAAILLLAFGIAVAHSRSVFAVIWYVVPMFGYQRIPQRAMVLAFLGLSVLVTIGVRWLIAWDQRRSFDLSHAPDGTADAPRRARWHVVVGSVVILCLTVESLVALPPLPPTADIRVEVRANEVLNFVARQDGRFRVHAIESDDRNWGVEHVTVPLDLSNLVGWDHLWLLEYLGAEGTVGRDVRPFLVASYAARHPARFWGLMNVRFVTSTRPLDMPGLRFVAEFPPCRACQPTKSAGPFLYENDDAMPRAWIVPEAIPVLGDRAQRLAVTYHLLDQPDFDPHRSVIVHAELPAPSMPNRVTQEFAEPPVIESHRDHFVRIRLAGQRGYLVLAEKFAHFPGWRTHSATGPRPLVKANGVATAIPLDGTEQWIELSYWPAGLTTGLIISGLAVVLVPMIGWFGDSARRQ